MRLGLRILETPYAWAMRWRNRRYDARRTPIERVPVPVVSVGNLTLGGTGKTPMVAWIARWLRRRGLRVTVISRGYGAEAGAVNDEALELEHHLPDVPHLQNPDRLEAARVAVEELGCELILLDDAFQHRRIARDLDLVMVDACEPFGFGHVFPRGTLREPLAGLARAHAVVLSRADVVDAATRARIRERIGRYAPEAAWAEVSHAPEKLLSFTGAEAPLSSLAGQPVGAFCGIGNPAGFRHTLEACACRVVAFREFSDHYRYERSDLESLADWAASLDVSAIVCTHKDLVKLGIDRLGPLPLRAVTITLRFLAGQEDIEASLETVLDAPDGRCREGLAP